MNGLGRNQLAALTRVELAVIVCFLVIVLAGLILPMLARAPSRPPTACKQNLMGISRALIAYSLNSEEYSPFDERGPLHALALLYPGYLQDPTAFVCPKSRDHRWKKNLLAKFPKGTSLDGLPCSYGYTWRISPAAPADFAIVADMPISHMVQESQIIGFNVLYFDGGVRWTQNAFCSYDPSDNIFITEVGWSPDTDSYIRQE